MNRPLISAVTGTNGKTTVSTAIVQMMSAIGATAAGYDSTGLTDVYGVVHEPEIRRSPDFFPEMIQAQVSAGAQLFSLEAFVGVIADGLLDKIEVDIAISTGFERDHLDVHGSIDAYWAAKLSLFDRYLRGDGIAILADDSAQGRIVESVAAERHIQLLSIGGRGFMEFVDREPRGDCTLGWLRVGAARYRASLPSLHSVTITNLLLAAAAVIAAGQEPAAVAEALAVVKPPPGRLEVVFKWGGVTAMVDTAHNPGALREALRAVRRRTSGRVIVVFGAGGERDRGKRPEMGAVARAFADLVILTDDNPRRESADAIRKDIRAGVPEGIEIPRREDAIRVALGLAREGDTVLVAGRGDEAEQVIGVRRVHMDDRRCIQEFAARSLRG